MSDRTSNPDAVFRPRSVAVIGASRQPGSLGGVIFANLLAQGFAGPVYPVNPKATFVHSVRAYPDVGALPEAPELAILVVSAAQVVATAEAAASGACARSWSSAQGSARPVTRGSRASRP